MPKAFDIDDFEAELEPIREVTLEPAYRHVATVTVDGVEFAMRGDKTLVDVKIPPEWLRRRPVPELEATLAEGFNRARLQADYEAGKLAAELLGVTAILADVQKDDLEKYDERQMRTAQLISGIKALLDEKSWTLADLARRSGIELQFFEDLFTFRYIPLEAAHGRTSLAALIDVVRPLARVFGVSPRVLWRKGFVRLQRVERDQRRLIKRALRALKMHRKGRRANPDKLRYLKLGNLRSSGVMAEGDLYLMIQSEILVDRRLGRKPWMKWPTIKLDLDEDCGPLLAQNAGSLRPEVRPADYKKLMFLDERAAKDPASVTEEEIEWAREYLGLPMLELPKPP